MADVIIIGDGPGGLSAALFLAKKKLEVLVIGQDKTLMHKAKLLNYLGIPEMTGTQFQQVARAQVQGFGARFVDAEATLAEKKGAGFAVTTADGQTFEGRYLILATGPVMPLAESLGLAKTSNGVAADPFGRTAVDKLYALGWGVRGKKIQAVISAGDGAAAALDILSAEKGEDLHDFDLV
ncbi:MAG: FAD-dependent oxidoreductase [Candidatus Latescibacteria bacterium]|nr:FAD-dependent oxidoreductase [Candidatus Latescibacterota bacterium]